MAIELTGCKECDKTLAEKKDLCLVHKLEMISAQITYWTNRACETLKEIKEKQNAESSLPHPRPE